MTNDARGTGVPPQVTLAHMINGYGLTGAICAVARLGLADLVGPGGREVGDLARAAGADEGALLRLLRAVSALGVFEEKESKRFAHTPLSLALREGVPGSMRGLAMMTSMLHVKVWPDFLYSVQTGRPAFDKVLGKPIFEYVSEHKEEAAAFDAAMASLTAATSMQVVEAYDFGGFGTVVDVGGGNGALLAMILGKWGAVKGVNFDLPHVGERAKAFLASRGVAARCEVVGGSFFESVPAGAAGDAYTLKMVLHDWDDEQATAILKTVRRAAAKGAKVLTIDPLIRGANEGVDAKMLDLVMLAMTGGRERTAEEFAALYRASGFELTRIVPAGPMIAVVEGVAV